MADEAIRSLRTLFLASLVVLLLWSLKWPSAVQQLQQYRDVIDLHAWVFLNERMGRMNWEAVGDHDPNAAVDEDCHEGIDPGPNCSPLQILTTWPTTRVQPLTLRPELYRPEAGAGSNEPGSLLRIYRVDAPSEDLPFSAYEVVVIGGQEAVVVPARDGDLYDCLRSDSLRLLTIAAKSRSRPRSWDDVMLHLGRHGFHEHPLTLRTNEPALARLAVESDPRALTVQVFGMPLGIGLFLSAVGVILGAIAFNMLGPMLALGRAGVNEVTSSWVMVTPTGTGVSPRLPLEALIALISLAWIAAPIVVMYLQLTADIPLQPSERVALNVGTVGLVLASAAHLMASLQLRACRRRPGV